MENDTEPVSINAEGEIEGQGEGDNVAGREKEQQEKLAQLRERLAGDEGKKAAAQLVAG